MNQVCWSLLSALKWRFSPFKGHTEKKLNTLQARDNLLLRSVFDQAKGKIGYMEKPESGIRSRKRKRNQNPNPNLRNKTWRLFCLKSVTNNYCLIKTFHPHIIFIYCYYIFYCRIFCVRRKIFLREFHIHVSVATWDHDWHEYSSSLYHLFLTMDETQSPFKKWVTWAQEKEMNNTAVLNITY